MDVAQQLAKQRAHLREVLPALIDGYFSVLEREGTHDLWVVAIQPFVERLMSELAEFELAPDATCRISSIFDPACSPAKRLRLEADAALTFARAKAAFPAATPREIDMRVALAVMGCDALSGSIAASLQAFFVQLEAKPIGAEPFPEVPLGTAVPYIWRQQRATAKEQLAGLPQENIIEFRLDQFTGESSAERLQFFGAGVHSCVGKAISLDAFRALGKYLNNLTSCVTSCELKIEPKHVLAVPTEMKVNIRCQTNK